MAAGEGLRQRKKRETLEAIQWHAARLCLRDGYDRVTVDMICAAAGISQRTFFNYVGTKENALLGGAPPLPDDAQRSAYVRGLGGTPFEDLVHTFAEVFVQVRASRGEMLRTQFAVIRRNPVLEQREAARMEAAKETLITLVRQRLAADGVTARTGVAEMTVALAVDCLHHMRRRPASQAPGGAREAANDALRLARQVTAPAGQAET